MTVSGILFHLTFGKMPAAMSASYSSPAIVVSLQQCNNLVLHTFIYETKLEAME